MSALPSSTLQRGVGTPPPARPRLFARTSADRTSPPPPARLTPLTPSVTPTLSPYATPPLWEEEHQRQVSTRAARHHANEEAETSRPTPAQSEMWWAASSAAAAAVPSLTNLSSTPASHGGARRPMQTRTAMHAATARSAPADAPPPQPRVMLTPPRGGSGSTAAREGSAEAVTADWCGHGRVESMLAAKRERFISSADTQHSVASSSTPPPRCKRAVSNNNNDEVGAATKPFEQHERLRLSGSTSRSSSSQGAISDSSSSDLIAAVTAMRSAAALSTTTSTGDAAASARAEQNTTETALAATAAVAATQCLVLDDTVDGAVMVTPAQLQRLLAQAADAGAKEFAGEEEAPTPYRRRLITAEVLRDWTGWEDLELVLATQLRVDAEAMIGVEQLGRMLPRLSSLKLNGSRIPRLRQLGTGYQALKYLWLNSCHLTDLRGLAACCPSLVELYVSFNHITDVTPVMELSATLEVLDVEGNLLGDTTSLGFVLSSLQNVHTLALQGNPITCEHQGRVRAAYAAVVEDEDAHVGSGNASKPFASSAQPERFGDVLRAWVRCLMPHLLTLNDEAMSQTAETSALRIDAGATGGAARVPSARSVHVDPLDDRLAEELRLVEACVREMDPFDPLREAVEESNQLVYTRPSTSCSGARPRLTPATAMGASRPSTSALSSTATSRRLGEATPTNASVLTTGAVLAGSATSSLRRRLATPTPTPPTSSLGMKGEREVSEGAARLTSTRLNEQADRCLANAVAETEEEEDARVAALLADDSDEEEWEHYKSSLLLSSSTTIAAAKGTAAAADAGNSLAKRLSLLDGLPAVHTRALEDGKGAALGAALAVEEEEEEDGFDKELKSEWHRLRLRMAKSGRA